MDTNNKTIYEDAQQVPQNNIENAQPEVAPEANQLAKQETLENEDNSNFKKRAAALGAAVFGGGIIGAGAGFFAHAEPGSTPSPISAEQSELQIVNEPDSSDFQTAFNDARLTLGPGAAFRWHGGLYSTYTKEEWDAMSAEERAEYGAKVNAVAHGTERDHATYEHNSHHHSHTHDEDSHDHVSNGRGSHEPQPQPHPVSNSYQIVEETSTTLNGHPVIAARAVHNGREVILIDADRDGIYDAEIDDLNNDGQLQDNEIIMLDGQNVHVSDTSLLNGGDDEIQVIVDGNEEVVTLDGHQVIADTATIQGHQAIIVDVNQDGTYDYAMIDVNNNGSIDDGETVNIGSENIHVRNAALIDVAQTDNLNPGSEFPDYVNTASMNNDGADQDDYAYQTPSEEAMEDEYAYQTPEAPEDIPSEVSGTDPVDDVVMDDTSVDTDVYDSSTDVYDTSLTV